MITVYHNPRCSKSREAFALVEQFAARSDMTINVIEYLKEAPAVEQLAELQQMLGGDAQQMMRTNEEEYASLKADQMSDSELLEAIHLQPKLLQRPIVVYRGKAIVARPPELLVEFLQEKL